MPGGPRDRGVPHRARITASKLDVVDGPGHCGRSRRGVGAQRESLAVSNKCIKRCSLNAPPAHHLGRRGGAHRGVFASQRATRRRGRDAFAFRGGRARVVVVATRVEVCLGVLVTRRLASIHIHAALGWESVDATIIHVVQYIVIVLNLCRSGGGRFHASPIGDFALRSRQHRSNVVLHGAPPRRSHRAVREKRKFTQRASAQAIARSSDVP